MAAHLVDLEVPRLWVLTGAVMRAVAGEDYGGVTMQTPPDIREGVAGRYAVIYSLSIVPVTLMPAIRGPAGPVSVVGPVLLGALSVLPAPSVGVALVRLCRVGSLR